MEPRESRGQEVMEPLTFRGNKYLKVTNIQRSLKVGKVGSQ